MNNTVLLLLGIAGSALAQILLKYSSASTVGGGRWFFLVAASLAFYGASFFAYSFLLRKEELSRISPLMTSSVMLLVVLAGLLLFGEQLTLRKGLGIALGMAAVFLLAR